ncbi:MAG: hypothetical protein WC774_02795 [Candidatus Gracilibacteria bacterium]
MLDTGKTNNVQPFYQQTSHVLSLKLGVSSKYHRVYQAEGKQQHGIIGPLTPEQKIAREERMIQSIRERNIRQQSGVTQGIQEKGNREIVSNIQEKRMQSKPRGLIINQEIQGANKTEESQKGIFDLKALISRACMYLTESDVSACADENGMVHFQKAPRLRVNLLPKGDAKKLGYTGCVTVRVETILNRVKAHAGITGISDPYTKEKMQSKADGNARLNTLKKKRIEIANTLETARRYSTSKHLVKKIDKIEVGDQIYFQLYEGGEAYAIKIKKASIIYEGTEWAMCDFIYRDGPIGGKGILDKFSNILIRLPIAQGEHLKCTSSDRKFSITKPVKAIFFHPFKNQIIH